MSNIIPQDSMIRLNQPAAKSRRLFRLLRRRPHELERDELALRLRAALNAQSCRDALLQIIDRTFSEVGYDRGRREIIVRCDVRGEKARAAASGMNLSLRQFYRRRSEAFDALALSVERIEAFGVTDSPSQPPVYCASCYRRIFDSPKLA